jgi:hypothetical protein
MISTSYGSLKNKRLYFLMKIKQITPLKPRLQQFLGRRTPIFYIALRLDKEL